MTTTTHPPMTINQRRFLESLARDLGWYQPELNAFTNARYGVDYTELSKQTASAAIDALLALGKEQRRNDS